MNGYKGCGERRLWREVAEGFAGANLPAGRTGGIFSKAGKLTIGLDLGDRFSAYCVLEESGKILLELKLPTTSEAMEQTFGKMAQCRIVMESGTPLGKPTADRAGARSDRGARPEGVNEKGSSV